MNLIDSHCHFPDSADAREVDELVRRAEEAGVAEMIAIGTEPGDWTRNRKIALRHPGKVHWTAGLHPSYVNADWEDAINRLEQILGTPSDLPPCALGEIGLDFTRLPGDDPDSRVREQYDAFRRQLGIAGKHDLPVVIHSRGTIEECLAVLRSEGFDPQNTLFHCFSEDEKAIRKLMEVRAKVSFTGIPTFKNAGSVRDAARLLGVEALILETDSPYLSPEPYRGRPNEPCRLRVIAEFFANFFSTDLDTITRISSKNTRQFFRLSS